MVELNKWYNDLIGCPSQCYYFFIDEDHKLKCIYLRWRWCDPWSVEIITFQENNPRDYWDLNCPGAEWEYIDLGYFRECELEKLQKKAVKKLVFRLWKRRKTRNQRR